MKAFVTKHALTKGIFEVEGSNSPDYPRMLSVQLGPGGWIENYHGEGRDWHRTRESALLRAEEMRKAKIASLKKQIKKLESLSFGAGKV